MHIFDMPIVIKGAGEMATGVAMVLYNAGFHNLVMFDRPAPLAVRRTVSFCEALRTGEQTVEGIHAVQVSSLDALHAAWQAGSIGICGDPTWAMLPAVHPHVVVDATIAKHNLGTHMREAPLVLGLGPGFVAGQDVHAVIETQRGHTLGRIIWQGAALPNTGEPEAVMGHTFRRVLRAPVAGEVTPLKELGDTITQGETVMQVADQPVLAEISGVLRGCIAPGVTVPAGCKIGDIDPRGDAAYCFTVSDKARSLGGAVLTAVLGKVAERKR